MPPEAPAKCDLFIRRRKAAEQAIQIRLIASQFPPGNRLGGIDIGSLAGACYQL
jgi:hypothetical protein